MPFDDRRARHVVQVLRRKTGDSFDAGILNGERGKATILSLDGKHLRFAFVATDTASTADPTTVIVGLPRPQTARDMLRESATFGVAAIHFVLTEKSDANYAQSTLWQNREWERHVIAGAEQAFDTRLPDVRSGEKLSVTLQGLPSSTGVRVALDNYENAQSLASGVTALGHAAAVIALGPERGWSQADRELLRDHGFAFAHLGRRVLRAETALIVALTLLKSARGLL